MDIHETVGGIHGIGEHSPEFQLGHPTFGDTNILIHGLQGLVILFRQGKLKQIPLIPQFAFDEPDDLDDFLERLSFLSQFLASLAVFPDGRIFRQRDDFLEPAYLGIEVKDTSAGAGFLFPGPEEGVAWH